MFALLLLADKNSRRLELLGFVNNEAVSSGECFIFNTDRMSCQFQEETWLDVAGGFWATIALSFLFGNWCSIMV